MKKIAVALLALAIVLTTVLVPILANGDAVTTVGYSSARIKKADLSDVADIKDYDEGTFEWAYKITDVEGLVKLSELVNGGNSLQKIYIHLAADLDMSEVEDFQPIGTRLFTINAKVQTPTKTGDGTMGGVVSATFDDTNSVAFEGQFDGRGHVIDNLKLSINGEELLYGGIFGYVKNATITNVIMGAGSSIEATYNGSGGIAGIVGFATGVTLIDNCYNLASVCADAQTKLNADPNHNFAVHAAGILGRGSATITNCTNTGKMVGVKSAGGILGYKEGSVMTISNCRNTGEVIGDKAGGITSRATVRVEGCINNGNVQGRDWVGGIMAAETGGYVKNSANFGVVSMIDGGVEDVAEGTVYVHQICPKAITLENNQEKAGETDPTLATDVVTITPDFDSVDEEGDETAYTTYETMASTQEVVIGTNTNPTGNEIGFSTARIEKADLSNVLNIKAFEEADPDVEAFKITDVDGWFELDRLLYEFNVFTEVTIYLAVDLDFSGVDEMTPISYDKENWTNTVLNPLYFFGGIFDGQGHQICNATINETWDGNLVDTSGAPIKNNSVAAGLFAFVQGATFKNVIIDDSCSFKTTTKAAYPLAGALVGYAAGITIDNCWNKAEVTGARQAGGLLGRTKTATDTHISNCTNSGNVTATYNAGGIAGYVDTSKNGTAEGGITCTNSRNVGKITIIFVNTDAGTSVAGFFARTWSPTIFDTCINNGDVISAGGTNAGAFVGTTKRAVILKNCKNFALLYEDAPMGFTGLVARADNASAPEPDALVTNVDNSSLDLYGQVDPTLMYEVLPEPVFTLATQTPGGDSTTAAPGGDSTTAAPGGDSTTAAPAGTTAAPAAPGGNSTTAAPGGAATTVAGTTAAATTAGAVTTAGGTDDAIDEGGCKSTVVGSFAVIALMSGAALTIFKKKED